MNFLIPFLYIVLGVFIGKLWYNSFKYISYILVNIIIPIVIVMTIVSYKGNVIHIVGLSYIFSLTMYKIATFIYAKETNTHMNALCFSYYNIGWLGLPISIVFFGDKAIPYIIGAYIGSMLFGISVGIYALNISIAESKTYALKKVVTSPPFIAFLAAILIKFIFGRVDLINNYPLLYSISKFLMSLFGMSILGIWMQKTKVDLTKWKFNIKFSLFRLFIGITIFSILIYGMYLIKIISLNEIKYLLIIPLLPIAANIVVLESFYLKSSESAHLIMINTIISLILLSSVYFFLN